MNKLSPFLKWAGGKNQLLSVLSRYFPVCSQEKFIYNEPFLGGGAVLFWVLNKYRNLTEVNVGDCNPNLINTYLGIKNDPYTLLRLLQALRDDFLNLNKYERSSYYYSIRDEFNFGDNSIAAKAAMFIFLNKTCFNGLYRENKKGEFNVSMGDYKFPTIFDKNSIMSIHFAIQKVNFYCSDFDGDSSLYPIKENSLFYFDPPYVKINSSSFNSYNSNLFKEEDHLRLLDLCGIIDLEGGKFILSGSLNDNQEINKYYKDYNLQIVNVRRSINSNGKDRVNHKEIIVSNIS